MSVASMASKIFELVRISEDDSEHSHVVRILLNGQPVVAVDRSTIYWEGPLGACTHVGKGPKQMLLAEDFVSIVSKLEESRSTSHKRPHSAVSMDENDRSNWTG
eukprot:scaffold11076_cov122-Cylindrotheca_fusiformis.AAC.5